MNNYNEGIRKHVKDRQWNHVPSVETMIKTRRESAGVAPLYTLVEYVCELNLPDEVFKDPVIREFEDLGMEIVSMYGLYFTNTS